MRPNRRDLITKLLPAGMAAAVVSLPQEKSGVWLWALVVGGNVYDKEGNAKTQEIRKVAEASGFELLDTIHQVEQRDKILVRRRMPSRETAQSIADGIINHEGYPPWLDKRLAFHTIWIEVL